MALSNAAMSDNGTVANPAHGKNLVQLLYADGHVKQTSFAGLVTTPCYGPYNMDWTLGGVGGVDTQ